jgi:hypothetical protein
MYDTLLQMGRWFGFRQGYEDLTRIYTTGDLIRNFSDLAFVERQIREDIQVYEDEGLNPLHVGVRIRSHPTMLVTSRLKSRFAKSETVSQSYSDKSTETVKFPLSQPEILRRQEDANKSNLNEFLAGLGTPDARDEKGPVWSGIDAGKVVAFIKKYQLLGDDPVEFSPSLIAAYVEKQMGHKELQRWTVAIRGRGTPDEKLGAADWNVPAKIWQISRTRIKNTDRLGVISDSKDEAIGFTAEQTVKMEEAKNAGMKNRKAARAQRSKDEGLLLLYPISRYSGYDITGDDGGNRVPLFENPESEKACDLLGLAFSFPKSEHPQPVVEYISGTVEGR